MKLIIRPERPADVAAIHSIHASSFPTEAEANLVDLLRAGEHLILSLVAEVDNAIVGHVAFSPVMAANGAVGVGLAPLAVMPQNRRQAIGARLVEEGLAKCQSAGHQWAVVLGEPGYYSRFGFRQASEFGLCDEYGGGPAFQAVELAPESMPIAAGLVKYGSEFAAFA